MIQLKKTLLTLVALLAVTTGAWADETPLVTIESNANTSFKSGSKTFDDKVTVTFSNSVENNGDYEGWYSDNTASLLTVAGINGYKITSCKFYIEGDWYAEKGYTVYGRSPSVYLSSYRVYRNDSQSIYLGQGITMIEVYGTAPVTVTFTRGTEEGKTNQWTMDAMPAGNVIVTPKYYPLAAFADDGAPKAITGVKATTDDPIVEPGVVKNIGETTNPQGTVMYYAAQSTTGTPDAPTYTSEGWSDQVPTAAGFQEGNVYVWYYIAGADAPTGTDPSDLNTCSDSEISATPLTVQVLSNKFDLTLSPAPVDKSKVTVTIGATAATDAQYEAGKIPNVQMGKTVKLAPKTGYKLRKVEVKKTQQQQP